MVITSNLHFAEWGGLLGDSVLATILLDRLLHHAEIITINSRSYRMRERIWQGIRQNGQRAGWARNQRRSRTAQVGDLGQIGLARVGQKPSAIWEVTENQK